MDLFFRIKEYLVHSIKAGNAHSIHSPFVYDLYTSVIMDNSPFYAFEKVESLRSKMVLTQEKIPVTDFGTGGEEKRQRLLSLSYITKHFAKPKKEAQLLFRLVNYFHPVNILEIGTSLGITTLYLAMPSAKSRVVTLEGCPNTAAVAKKNFSRLASNNIELIQGEFGKSLPEALALFDKLDFVYFDGNHRREPTLDYFNQCLPLHHQDTVFVFDDIHWSRGMAEAWIEICNHPSVTVSIDLFSLGLVFFRDAGPKQHFRLRN